MAEQKGFSLGDFASTCLRRREPGNYAAKWGLKLQEVLLDRCRMSKCQVISVKVEDLVHAGPDVLAEAEVIGRKLRRTLAEREAKRHCMDVWLDFPCFGVGAKIHHAMFE